jgi:hypothetical protein
MASNSAIEALRPFIFQLPAISGRMASVISGSPRGGVVHALAEAGHQFQTPALRRQPLIAWSGLPRRGCDEAAATL